MGYAFISYSSQDSEITDQLRHLLSLNNIDTWVAPDDIPVGSKYAQVINKAIKNSACVLLLLTKASMNSQWVAKEIERAIHYKKIIFPIKLEDLELTDEFELYISTEQILSVDTFDENSSEIRYLIAAISAHTSASTYTKAALEAEILQGHGLEDDKPHELKKAPQISAEVSKEGKKKTVFALIIGGIAVVLILMLLLTSAVSNLFKNSFSNSMLDNLFQSPSINLSDIQSQITTSTTGNSQITSQPTSSTPTSQPTSSIPTSQPASSGPKGEKIRGTSIFAGLEFSIYQKPSNRFVIDVTNNDDCTYSFGWVSGANLIVETTTGTYSARGASSVKVSGGESAQVIVYFEEMVSGDILSITIQNIQPLKGGLPDGSYATTMPITYTD